jgi:hypothetical protein
MNDDDHDLYAHEPSGAAIVAMVLVVVLSIAWVILR